MAVETDFQVVRDRIARRTAVHRGQVGRWDDSTTVVPQLDQPRAGIRRPEHVRDEVVPAPPPDPPAPEDVESVLQAAGEPDLTALHGHRERWRPGAVVLPLYEGLPPIDERIAP